MTKNDNTPEGEILCKACGLCCTGCFHYYVGLRTEEVKIAQNLGLTVVREPHEESLNFKLPCPLWDLQCTIYDHPNKPKSCGTWKCQLLKDVDNRTVLLKDALNIVAKTKALINELEGKISTAQNGSFIGRIMTLIPQFEKEAPNGNAATGKMLLDMGILLAYFSRYFGIMDIFSQQMPSEPSKGGVESTNQQTIQSSDQIS